MPGAKGGRGVAAGKVESSLELLDGNVAGHVETFARDGARFVHRIEALEGRANRVHGVELGVVLDDFLGLALAVDEGEGELGDGGFGREDVKTLAEPVGFSVGCRLCAVGSTGEEGGGGGGSGEDRVGKPPGDVWDLDGCLLRVCAVHAEVKVGVKPLRVCLVGDVDVVEVWGESVVDGLADGREAHVDLVGHVWLELDGAPVPLVVVGRAGDPLVGRRDGRGFEHGHPRGQRSLALLFLFPIQRQRGGRDCGRDSA